MTAHLEILVSISISLVVGVLPPVAVATAIPVVPIVLTGVATVVASAVVVAAARVVRATTQAVAFPAEMLGGATVPTVIAVVFMVAMHLQRPLLLGWLS